MFKTLTSPAIVAVAPAIPAPSVTPVKTKAKKVAAKKRVKKAPVVVDPNVIYGVHFKGRLLGTYTRKELKNLDPVVYGGTWFLNKKIIGLKKGVVKTGIRYFSEAQLDEIEIVAYTPNKVAEKISAAGIKAEREAAAKLSAIKSAKRSVKYYKNMIDYYNKQIATVSHESAAYHNYMHSLRYNEGYLKTAEDKLAALLNPVV